VVLDTPSDLDRVSAFLNIRVADIHAADEDTPRHLTVPAAQADACVVVRTAGSAHCLAESVGPAFACRGEAAADG